MENLFLSFRECPKFEKTRHFSLKVNQAPDWPGLGRIKLDWAGLGRIAQVQTWFWCTGAGFFTFYTGRSRVARKNACKTYLWAFENALNSKNTSFCIENRSGTRLARIGPDWIGLGRIGPDRTSSNMILMHRCGRFFTFYTNRSRAARKNASEPIFELFENAVNSKKHFIMH